MEIRGTRIAASDNTSTVYRLSVLYHYCRSRGSLRADGSLPSLTIDRALATARNGVASLAGFPAADPDLFTVADVPQDRPRPKRREIASLEFDPRRRTKGFERIGRRNENDWIEALNNEHPILAGVHLPDQYWHDVRSGQARSVDCSSAPIRDNTGHAVVIRGYETTTTRTRFRVRDSFGTDCGENGEWWLSSDCLDAIVHQAWAITNVNFSE
jgi:hypothetical protein